MEFAGAVGMGVEKQEQEEKKLKAKDQDIIIQGMGVGRGEVNHAFVKRQEKRRIFRPFLKKSFVHFSQLPAKAPRPTHQSFCSQIIYSVYVCV